MEKRSLELGNNYFEESRQKFVDRKLDDAIRLAEKALEQFSMAEAYGERARTLNLMGVIYGACGSDSFAIDCYMEGLEYAREHHLDQWIALINNNIGSKYQQLGEHKKALRYFRECEKWMEGDQAKTFDGYSIWAMVLYINLSKAYFASGRQALAREYLDRAKPYLAQNQDSPYLTSFLIAQTQLRWYEGKTKEIEMGMDTLVNTVTRQIIASDYVPDTLEVASLLKRMRAYDAWEKVILSFQDYAREQKSVYYKITLLDMWMDYYKTLGRTQEYQRLCVEHAQAYLEKKEWDQQERVAIIDLRIEVQRAHEKRKSTEQLANTDILTGLGNRNKLEKDIGEWIRTQDWSKRRFSIGILDVDSFKGVNDSHGHLVGDDCLSCVAAAIRGAVGQTGQAYRYGGDEFVLVLDQDDPQALEALAKEISAQLGQLQQAHETLCGMPPLTLSQGYVICQPRQEESFHSLLECADKALYQVKNTGKDDFCIYTRE